MNMIHAAGRLGLAAAILVVAAAAAEPQPGLDLTIDEAINRALNHNRQLALQAISTERAGLSKSRNEQAFALSARPDVRVERDEDGTREAYGMVLRKKFSPGTELILDSDAAHIPAFLDNDWRATVRVEIRQPLFRSFGSLVQMEPVTAAAERVLAQQRDWELQKAHLVIDVARTFESIVRLDRQIQADAGVRERAEKLSELTKARQVQGRASRVDSLRAAMQFEEARARMQSHIEERYSAQRGLAELLGADPNATFNLATPPMPEVEIPDVDAAIQVALSNRMDFAQAIQNLDAAERGARIGARKALPEIRLVGRHEQFGEGDRFGEASDLDESRWVVGLESDYDLNRTSDRIEIRTTALDAEAARQELELRALSITREVQQALSEVRRRRSNLSIATRNFELASARAELARSLFEIGRGDSFAATDAEAALSEAQLRLLQARADRSIATYAMLRAMGTLIDHPEALKPSAAGGVAP